MRHRSPIVSALVLSLIACAVHSTAMAGSKRKRFCVLYSSIRYDENLKNVTKSKGATARATISPVVKLKRGQTEKTIADEYGRLLKLLYGDEHASYGTPRCRLYSSRAEAEKGREALLEELWKVSKVPNADPPPAIVEVAFTGNAKDDYAALRPGADAKPEKRPPRDEVTPEKRAEWTAIERKLADAYFRRGMRLYKEQDFSQAEKYFRAVLKGNPNDPMARPTAYQYLAKALGKQGKWQEAAAELRKALKVMPRGWGFESQLAEAEAAMAHPQAKRLVLYSIGKGGGEQRATFSSVVVLKPGQTEEALRTTYGKLLDAVFGNNREWYGAAACLPQGSHDAVAARRATTIENMRKKGIEVTEIHFTGDLKRDRLANADRTANASTEAKPLPADAAKALVLYSIGKGGGKQRATFSSVVVLKPGQTKEALRTEYGKLLDAVFGDHREWYGPPACLPQDSHEAVTARRATTIENMRKKGIEVTEIHFTGDLERDRRANGDGATQASPAQNRRPGAGNTQAP